MLQAGGEGRGDSVIWYCSNFYCVSVTPYSLTKMISDTLVRVCTLFINSITLKMYELLGRRWADVMNKLKCMIFRACR